MLDLGGAGLGDPAAAAVAAAWVPLRKLGLERLHLGGNDISDAGLTQWALRFNGTETSLSFLQSPWFGELLVHA